MAYDYPFKAAILGGGPEGIAIPLFILKDQFMFRFIKYTTGAVVAVFIGGFLLFGSDLTSMVKTSANSIRQSARESVPVEFELDRAKDQINDILPDLQSQVRMIAEEEVAISRLEKEVTQDQQRMAKLEQSLSGLRKKVRTNQVSWRVGEANLDRQQFTKHLQSRFSHLKQAKLSTDSKERLLAKRREGLAAAVTLLEEMRLRQSELELKVESLAAQHRLVKASAIDSGQLVDDSNLSQADQLLGEIENRIEVAERMMTYERGIMDVPVEEDTGSTESVLAEIDQYFGPDQNALASEVE